MDYCCLELLVYRNSQDFLVELLDSSCSAGQRIIECEKLIESHFLQVPYSEERLALFVMAFIGMNLADECLQKAFHRGKRRVVIGIQKRFVHTQENDSRHCVSTNVIALLLGVKARWSGAGIP